MLKSVAENSARWRAIADAEEQKAMSCASKAATFDPFLHGWAEMHRKSAERFRRMADELEAQYAY